MSNENPGAMKAGSYSFCFAFGQFLFWTPLATAQGVDSPGSAQRDDSATIVTQQQAETPVDNRPPSASPAPQDQSVRADEPAEADESAYADESAPPPAPPPAPAPAPDLGPAPPAGVTPSADPNASTRNSAPPEATADIPGTTQAVDAAKDGEATQWLADHFFGHIRVRGYTQFRFNQPASNPQLVNLQGDRSMGGSGQFFIRRARIALYGDIHPLIYIYFQPDFASATDSGLHFVQLRDWYADLAVPGKELRLRVGQSKVPYGFENMQSSQNRLPLDRSDPINSALVNERDLGAFLYWAPRHIRQRLSDLTRKGLKGSGDYGVAALGVFNGQTNNRPDLNSNKHVVARVSYPFLFGKQYLEIGGGGYYGKYVVRKDDGITGPDEFHDARGHLALVLYPQPFGLQIEYNAGIGPELSNLQATTTDQGTVYSGQVREQFLHGGYALLSYKVDHQRLGTIIPYARAMLYEGGKKHETNAPSYSVRELEVGLEWQPIRALEFVSAFTAAERTAATPPYQQESGFLARFQLQINY